MKPLNFGLFSTDKPAAIYVGAQRLDLTPMAARLLAKLGSAPAGVKRSELLGTNGGVPNSSTLRVHLCAIRQALPATLAVEYLPEAEAYQLATR